MVLWKIQIKGGPGPQFYIGGPWVGGLTLGRWVNVWAAGGLTIEWNILERDWSQVLIAT